MIEMSLLKDTSEIIHYNNPNIPLYVQQGRLSLYANMEALCHYHEDIEYVKTRKGHMSYYVNGEKIIIREHDALLVNSRQMHYGFSDDKTDCTFICMIFRLQLLSSNPEIIGKYIQPIAEHPNLPYYYLDSSIPGANKIIGIFDELYDRYQKKEIGFELMCISLLTAFWAGWLQLLGDDLMHYHTNIDENLSIQRTMVSFIYQNYASKLFLQDIANAGSVCRSKCCRIFQKYLNRTPIEFLNAYRLEVSMRLLTDASMSITEIALSCGFQSPSYYAEIFQHYKGDSPSNYRIQQAKPAFPAGPL